MRSCVCRATDCSSRRQNGGNTIRTWTRLIHVHCVAAGGRVLVLSERQQQLRGYIFCQIPSRMFAKMWGMLCGLLIATTINYSGGSDSLLPQSDTPRKCCDKDFVLSLSHKDNLQIPRCVLTFNSSENERIQTILSNEGKSKDFPNCSTVAVVSVGTSKEYCVDYVSSNLSSTVGLSCADQIASGAKTTLKKCCPEGYKYNMNLRTCYRANVTDDIGGSLLNFLAENSTQFDDIAYGMPNCSEVMVDFTFDDRRISNLTMEEFRTDSICVDHIYERDVIGGRRCAETKRVCGNIPCVRKCCPPGQNMKSAKCSPDFGRGFNLTFHDVSDPSKPTPILEPTEYGIFHGVACAHGLGKYPLMHHSTATDKNYLSPEGTILHQNNALSSDEYCMEDVNIAKKGMDGVFTFACVKKEYQAIPSSKVPYILISVGLILSCIFLLATLVVYACLPSLQNLHGMTLMCHVASFLVAFVCLTIVQIGSVSSSLTLGKNLVFCRFIGFTMLFAFMAAFAWMNIMCFDIWWTFGGVRSVNRSSRKNRERKRLAWYSLYAWGLATVVTATAFLFDAVDNLVPRSFKPMMGDPKCWFPKTGESHSELLFFFMPLAVLISCNVVLFVLTARSCSKVKAEINRMQKSTDDRCKKKFQADMNKFMMNGKLFVVMGATWTVELLGFLFPSVTAWVYILDAFNALIGIFIFAIFVLKPKVWNELSDRLGIARMRRDAPKNDAANHTPNSRDPRKSSMSSSCVTTVTSVNATVSPVRL